MDQIGGGADLPGTGSFKLQNTWEETRSAFALRQAQSAIGHRLRFALTCATREPIVMECDKNLDGDFADTNEVVYYAQNNTYNVAALFDASGDIVEHYKYDPYGKATIYTGKGNDDTWFTSDDDTGATSVVKNPYTFTGRRLDNETGLMYFRNRYYSVDLGRFISRDPLLYVNGWNLYAGYFGMKMKRDPFGYALIDYNGDDKNDEKDDEIEDIIWAIGWYDALQIQSAPDQARKAAKQTGEPGDYGGRQDALRHCIWLCLMARKIGKEQALEVGDIHEEHNPPSNRATPPRGYSSVEEWQKADTEMDKHNNEVGATLGEDKCCGDCVECCRKALEDGKLQVNVPGGYVWGNGGGGGGSFGSGGSGGSGGSSGYTGSWYGTGE